MAAKVSRMGGVKVIKIIRESKGWSQYRLAQEMGIPSTTILFAEKKGRSFRLDLLARLRNISGLSWAEFGKLIDAEFLDVDEPEKKGRRK